MLALAAFQALILAMGAWIGWPLALFAAGLVLVFGLLGPDYRAAAIACLFASAFTMYIGGHLTRDLSIVLLLAVSTVFLASRECRAHGWTLPPGREAIAFSIWFLGIAYGALMGVVHGNSAKAMGIELAGACALGLGIASPAWRIRPGGVRIALAGFIAVAYCSAAFGISGYYHYHRRLADAWFSPFPAMGAIILICIGIYSPRSRHRIAAILLSLPLLVHLLLSYTRGYWLGFAAGVLGLVALLVFGRGRGNALRLFRLLVLCLVFTGALGLVIARVLGQETGGELGRRFESSYSGRYTGNNISKLVRLVEIHTTLQLVMQNPVAGYGAGATIVLRDPLIGSREEHPYIHQMMLFQWYKYGLLGLLAMLYIQAVFGFAGWKEAAAEEWWRAALGATVFACTIMVFVICLTNFSLNQVFVAMPLSFLWGLLIPMKVRHAPPGISWSSENP